MSAARIPSFWPIVPSGHVRARPPEGHDAISSPCEYVGMADYAPASFLELLYNETLESDGSMDGDKMVLRHPPS